jgi:tetratricopeptide (TPR) repeat protein
MAMVVRPLFFAALTVALLASPAHADLSEWWRTCTGESDVDWQVQIESCTRIIESGQEEQSKLAIAFLFRGFAWQNTGDLRTAISDYTAAIRLDPDLGPAYFHRGQAWLSEGELDRAIADYTELIRIYPDDAEYYRDRALMWKDKGDYARAVADLTDAIRCDPSLPSAYFLRGNLLVVMGELDRAVANYSELIANDPDEDDGFGYRGYVHFYRSDFPASATDLNKAIELRPFSANNEERAPLRYLARARAGQDGTAELAAQVARWKEINADRDLPRVFDLFLGRITPEAALKDVGSPRAYCRTHFFVGQWHLIRGNRNEARQRLQVAASERCNSFEPHHPAAVFELRRMGP